MLYYLFHTLFKQNISRLYNDFRGWLWLVAAGWMAVGWLVAVGIW